MTEAAERQLRHPVRWNGNPGGEPIVVALSTRQIKLHLLLTAHEHQTVQLAPCLSPF